MKELFLLNNFTEMDLRKLEFTGLNKAGFVGRCFDAVNAETGERGARAQKAPPKMQPHLEP